MKDFFMEEKFHRAGLAKSLRSNKGFAKDHGH
jgi:hypothetical protein